MRLAIVVPSNRPESLARWRQEWAPYLGPELIVVEDAPATWQAIRDELGPDAWIIPRQTDCVRMWGYLQALDAGADLIVTMDDDCWPEYPLDAFREHLRALTTPTDAPGWGRMLDDVRTRGIPEGPCPVINHGLWTNEPDLDGDTQLAGPPLPEPTAYPLERMLKVGTFYPISGMNLAWQAAWTPLMYFGLMGHHIETGAHWGVDRFGDIWAGVAAKRAADHLGATIRSGTPFVHHARASDPVVNQRREVAGKALTPIYTHAVATARLTGTTVATVAHELADAVGWLGGDYWPRYSDAWHHWIDLTKEPA
jgi:reversibly glycosylated polypeptide/UDP-arabinopyranose mutase